MSLFNGELDNGLSLGAGSDEITRQPGSFRARTPDEAQTVQAVDVARELEGLIEERAADSGWPRRARSNPRLVRAVIRLVTDTLGRPSNSDAVSSASAQRPRRTKVCVRQASR